MIQHVKLRKSSAGGRCLRCGAAPAGGTEKSAVEVVKIRMDL